jgi:hypothetical protein
MRTHSAQTAEWELREAALRIDPDERSKRAFACLLLTLSGSSRWVTTQNVVKLTSPLTAAQRDA